MTEEQPTDRWAVALSGGGHRAALYAAGALLYLVRARVNERVDTVASVSGGSLTNGVLAQAPVDFCAMSEDDYLAAIGPLLDRCTYKGTVQWAASVVAWGIATLLVVLATLGLLVGSVAHWFRDWLGFETDRPGLYFCGALVVALVLLWPLLSIRCRLADGVFRRLLFSPGGRAVKLQASADDRTRSDVLHVFCSSELQSNLHAYFSPRFVYNMDFKVSTEFPTVNLSTAVQVSSNFPPAFPARRISTKRLGLPRRPGAPALWLTDGGVYDNMAEEWITRSFSRNPDDARPIPDDLLEKDPDRLLVVNASKRDSFKAAKAFRTPFLGELLGLLRISSLMHQVTTTNRRSRLVNEFSARHELADLGLPAEKDGPTKLDRAIGLPGSLVHIGTAADWLPRKHPKWTGGLFGEVNAAFAQLGPEDTTWARGTHDTVLGLGTKLSKAGEDAAAALLWQGFALTMVALHLDGDGPVLPVPTEQEIRGILRNARPAT